MKMNEYQRRARITAIYPKELKVIYPALGLAGEAGEVCEKIKKGMRGDLAEEIKSNKQSVSKWFDNAGKLQRESNARIGKELGDVLWYVANLATDLGLDLDDIATKNIDKLRDRERRNVLQGDGDDR